jgi:hypothetical protein
MGGEVDPEHRAAAHHDAAAPPASEVRAGVDCEGFQPGGRVAEAPVAHCAGPARDRVTGLRDAAALRKVDEVLSSPGFHGDVDQDLALLLSTSTACGAHCTAPVQARVWMYIGLWYGSGLANLENARCAFENAFDWAPAVPFDEALATEAVKATFAGARARACR